LLGRLEQNPTRVNHKCTAKGTNILSFQHQLSQ